MVHRRNYKNLVREITGDDKNKKFLDKINNMLYVIFILNLPHQVLQTP